MAKRRILNLYREDVVKFAEGYEDKVFAVFDGIPGQLSKEAKKYKLSSLGKTARFTPLFCKTCKASLLQECICVEECTSKSGYVLLT